MMMAHIKNTIPRKTYPNKWGILMMEVRAGNMPPFGKWPDKYTRLSSSGPYTAPIEDIHHGVLPLIADLLLEDEWLEIPVEQQQHYDKDWLRDTMTQRSPDMQFDVDGIVNYLPSVLNKGTFPCLPGDSVGMSNHPEKDSRLNRWFYWYQICEELYVGVSVTEWENENTPLHLINNRWYRFRNAGYKKLPDQNKMTFARDDEHLDIILQNLQIIDIELWVYRTLGFKTVF